LSNKDGKVKTSAHYIREGNMNKQQFKEMMGFAIKRCEAFEKKLTPKRQQVFEILLKANKPLSAYELTDQFNKQINTPILAMSVYRILGFLESVGLVHRLKLENKFIPCSHVNDDREHQLSMFLICSSCNKASEVNDLNNSVKSLFRELKMKGFASNFAIRNLRCLFWVPAKYR